MHCTYHVVYLHVMNLRRPLRQNYVDLQTFDVASNVTRIHDYQFVHHFLPVTIIIRLRNDVNWKFLIKSLMVCLPAGLNLNFSAAELQ